jgi:Predicted hydrolase of the alpha/beta-hydrolase fold
VIQDSTFVPAGWLPGPHLQTLWPTVVRHPPRVHVRRERLELPDGDFLDLAWTRDTGGPQVLVLHGLEGSVQSPYAAGILFAIAMRGWCGVLMHFRGCSGEMNRLPRSYHSGETDDLQTVVEQLVRRNPETPLAAVGYSLGGNVLLKWLGETGASAPLSAAVAVSVPFLLHEAAERLERGFSRLYQWVLLRHLCCSTERKFRHMKAPLPLPQLRHLKTFRQFDDAVTAPLHGFTGVDDYYAQSSSRRYLSGIHVPTLILHAADDPFMTPSVIPDATELSKSTTLELSPQGGHVGFVSGTCPFRATYWLEERIPAYLATYLHERKKIGP